jgi:hypothetical protein
VARAPLRNAGMPNRHAGTANQNDATAQPYAPAHRPGGADPGPARLGGCSNGTAIGAPNAGASRYTQAEFVIRNTSARERRTREDRQTLDGTRSLLMSFDERAMHYDVAIGPEGATSEAPGA